jgi:antitoxin (DNA-binding transcriptional repressor) of toxin-antitoxin stability system
MKTATVAELQNNFETISTWLQLGETVHILKEGRPFAKISAISNQTPPLVLNKPDFKAQLDRVWGDRVFSMQEVEVMRNAELEHGIG